MISEVLDYYRDPGEITRLDRFKEFTDWLPADPGAIYQVVQGLIVHDMWLSHYGEVYDKSHEYPQRIAYMEDLLDKALELDPSSLAIPRHPRDRVIACCREFATLMCALLRAKGIPARARCGFEVYFGWSGKYGDHWICEHWNGECWIRTDPQMDPFQQAKALEWSVEANRGNEEKLSRIRKFDPRCLKPDEFLTAGKAWLLCRCGEATPADFGIDCPIRPEWGIDSLHGLWFVRGQLLRDFAALNKVETVPYLIRISKGLDWSGWRLVGARDEDLSEEDLALLDKIAELSIDADRNFGEIWDLYFSNNGLSVPEEILCR